MKRKLSARVPLTEAAFELALDEDDLESISGSESVRGSAKGGKRLSMS